MELTPETLNEWIPVLWSIGWKGLLVFFVIFGRELWIHWGKVVADVIASWIKRK